MLLRTHPWRCARVACYPLAARNPACWATCTLRMSPLYPLPVVQAVRHPPAPRQAYIASATLLCLQLPSPRSTLQLSWTACTLLDAPSCTLQAPDCQILLPQSTSTSSLMAIVSPAAAWVSTHVLCLPVQAWTLPATPLSTLKRPALQPQSPCRRRNQLTRTEQWPPPSGQPEGLRAEVNGMCKSPAQAADGGRELDVPVRHRQAVCRFLWCKTGCRQSAACYLLCETHHPPWPDCSVLQLHVSKFAEALMTSQHFLRHH